MTNLLRPRIIFTLFLILGVGALVWFWYFSPALSGNEIYLSNEKKSASIEENWEEALKKLSETSQTNATPGPAENIGEPPNLTEAFSSSLANSLGPRILERDLKNISLSDIQGAASYLPSANALLPNPPEITLEDIKISETNDPASVKKYFESVFGVYKKTFFALKEDDFSIIERAFREKKFEEFEEIDVIIEAFDKSFMGVKKLPVPRGWENFAIKELDYLSRSKQILEKLRSSGNDPITILILLPKRVELMNEINKFHEDTGETLKRAGIIFLESEEAYQLFN